MHAIRCEQIGKHTISLMHVKKSMYKFCLRQLLSGTLNEENERKNKNIEFKLTLFNLCKLSAVLPFMTPE